MRIRIKTSPFSGLRYYVWTDQTSAHTGGHVLVPINHGLHYVEEKNRIGIMIAILSNDKGFIGMRDR